MRCAMNPIISVGCGLSSEGTGDYDFTILRPTEPMITATFTVCQNVVSRLSPAMTVHVVKARFYHDRYHQKAGVETPVDLPGVILPDFSIAWSEEGSKEEITASVFNELKEIGEFEFSDNWLLKPKEVKPSEFRKYVDTCTFLVLKAIRVSARKKRVALLGRGRAIKRAVAKIV